MLRRLPSLGALRAFEATIRCGGLAGAAEELAVTPSAVSHQIKQLENELGIKLVRREGRRLVTTHEGELLTPGLQEAFERISTSVAQLKERDASAPLRISMLPNFAINWFLPRLHRFNELNPDIAVEVSMSLECADFARENVDMAIRLARRIDPPLVGHVVFQDQLTPVCSPDFLARHGPFTSPRILRHLQLLVSDGRPADAWGAWFRSLGIFDGLPERMLHLDSSQLALQAAGNGIGIAICGRRLAAPSLQRGTLITPFKESVPEHGTFYSVCPEVWANRPKVHRMRTWMIAEAAQVPDC